MNGQSLRKSKPKWMFILLGIYDLLLTAGALYAAIQMLRGADGLFSTFPTEWIGKLPFESWTPIGCIALFFAAGNAAAAVFCLTSRKHALASLVMGFLLAVGMAAQIIVLSETYLATGEFLIAAFIQIVISAALLIRRRFVATATEHAR